MGSPPKERKMIMSVKNKTYPGPRGRQYYILSQLYMEFSMTEFSKSTTFRFMKLRFGCCAISSTIITDDDRCWGCVTRNLDNNWALVLNFFFPLIKKYYCKFPTFVFEKVYIYKTLDHNSEHNWVQNRSLYVNPCALNGSGRRCVRGCGRDLSM